MKSFNGSVLDGKNNSDFKFNFKDKQFFTISIGFNNMFKLEFSALKNLNFS